MIIEYFVFDTNGSLVYTCPSLEGFEDDIETRSLTAIGSETKHDLDYSYTLSGTTIISEYSPAQNPLENA
jgi:hypothetical protein